MFCPDCGFNAGAAKFCPECGANLTTVRNERSDAAPTSNDARSAAPPSDDVRPAAGQPRRSPSAKLIWIAAVIIVVAVIIAVFVVHDHGSSTGATPTASASASAPAKPDLSGSYAALVARGDGYYETGAPYANSGNFTAAEPWFTAAAKVLQAAWNKQPGDPTVGADLANSLFYAGNIQGAITQIDIVLKKSPKNQEALLDKGNFVNMAGQMDKEADETTQANAEIAQAKQLYQEAIKIAPTSASGKAAATELKAL